MGFAGHSSVVLRDLTLFWEDLAPHRVKSSALIPHWTYYAAQVSLVDFGTVFCIQRLEQAGPVEVKLTADLSGIMDQGLDQVYMSLHLNHPVPTDEAGAGVHIWASARERRYWFSHHQTGAK